MESTHLSMQRLPQPGTRRLKFIPALIAMSSMGTL